VLLGLGVDELSADVPLVPAVKARVRPVARECRRNRARGARRRGRRPVRAIVAAARLTPTRPAAPGRLESVVARAFGWLQKIGKSLMLPLACSGAASCSAWEREVRGAAPTVSNVMAQAGNAIFGNSR
jgi:hypothetical protein